MVVLVTIKEMEWVRKSPLHCGDWPLMYVLTNFQSRDPVLYKCSWTTGKREIPKSVTVGRIRDDIHSGEGHHRPVCLVDTDHWSTACADHAEPCGLPFGGLAGNPEAPSGFGENNVLPPPPRVLLLGADDGQC